MYDAHTHTQYAHSLTHKIVCLCVCVCDIRVCVCACVCEREKSDTDIEISYDTYIQHPISPKIQTYYCTNTAGSKLGTAVIELIAREQLVP